jgi:hypothetical protein
MHALNCSLIEVQHGLVFAANDEKRGSFDLVQGVLGQIRTSAPRNYRRNLFFHFGGRDQRSGSACACPK